MTLTLVHIARGVFSCLDPILQKAFDPIKFRKNLLLPTSALAEPAPAESHSQSSEIHGPQPQKRNDPPNQDRSRQSADALARMTEASEEAHPASSAANEMSPAFPTPKSLDVVVSGNGLNDRGGSISNPTAGATPHPTVDIDKILGRKVFTTSRRLKLRYYRRLEPRRVWRRPFCLSHAAMSDCSSMA